MDSVVLTQTLLIARHRVALHRRLGIAALRGDRSSLLDSRHRQIGPAPSGIRLGRGVPHWYVGGHLYCQDHALDEQRPGV